MSWAEVIKINSDMSTPLNEFFIKNSHIYTSENILSSTNSTNNKIKVNYGGACKVYVNTLKSASGGSSVKFKVYKNNSEIETRKVTAPAIEYVNIGVNAGDTISISDTSTGASGYISDWGICGSIGLGADIAEIVTNS